MKYLILAFIGLLSLGSFAASFPETISYSEMDVLAKGQSIEFEGQKITAVSKREIRDNAPGYLKRTARIAAYKAGGADAPVANRLGEQQDSGQISLQTYLYKAAANMGVTFQFSLYSVDESKPEGNQDILNTAKERDRIENLRYSEGNENPEVLIYDRKTDLMAQRDELKVELDQLKKRRDELDLAMETAVTAKDLIAYKYLRLLAWRTHSDILISQQKLGFLEKKALKMMDEQTPQKEIDGRGYPVFDTEELKSLTNDVFDRSFYSKGIDDETAGFLKEHADAQERAKKYDLSKI